MGGEGEEEDQVCSMWKLMLFFFLLLLRITKKNIVKDRKFLRSFVQPLNLS